MDYTEHAKGGATCVALCLSLFLASCTAHTASLDAQGRIQGVVQNVIDGDTAIVRFGSRTETIRLLGIDTPETKHPTKPVGCFGPEASAHTHALLPPGTLVFVERDEEARDKYGRLLAYMHRATDNLFINHELVAGGWAVPLSIAPNFAHESDFAAAAHSAEQADLGLWGHCPR